MRLWLTLLAIFSIYLHTNATDIFSAGDEAEYAKFLETYRSDLVAPLGFSPEGENR